MSTQPAAVVPFWQRLGAISRYPLQMSALLTIGLFTALRLVGYLPFGFVLNGLVTMGILRYAVEVLVHTAHGGLDAPEYSVQVSESQAWDQIKLQLLLIVMLLGGGILLMEVAGPIAAILWMLFVAIAVPGATITLAMTNNLWGSLNPFGWIELMRAFGWPYFAVALLCGLYQIGGANAQGFALPFLPEFIGYLLNWFITHYVLVMSFHLMGYLVLQYADRIGHEVKRDAAPEVLRRRHADPDQDLIDETEAMVREGRQDEAAGILIRHLHNRGGTVLLHDLYRRLQKARNDSAALVDHAKLYLPSLLAQNNEKRAIELLQETWALAPEFVAEVPDDIARLSERASQLGQHALALKLISGFHKRWPKHKDIARNYLFAARLLVDKLNREDQAMALLSHLKQTYPDHELMPEIDRQLLFLQSLAGRKPGAAPAQ